jgi:hypothetical protein
VERVLHETQKSPIWNQRVLPGTKKSSLKGFSFRDSRRTL